MFATLSISMTAILSTAISTTMSALSSSICGLDGVNSESSIEYSRKHC